MAPIRRAIRQSRGVKGAGKIPKGWTVAWLDNEVVDYQLPYAVCAVHVERYTDGGPFISTVAAGSRDVVTSAKELGNNVAVSGIRLNARLVGQGFDSDKHNCQYAPVGQYWLDLEIPLFKFLGVTKDGVILWRQTTPLINVQQFENEMRCRAEYGLHQSDAFDDDFDNDCSSRTMSGDEQ